MREALAEHGGGFVVAAAGSGAGHGAAAGRGAALARDADVVCRQLEEVNRAVHALGLPLEAPFGTLSFLALPVIPELRITTQGVFDVREQRFVKL